MKPYLREREKESKVSTVTGIVLTVAVHVLACLLFVFSGLKYIYPPPQEQTFVIDFQEEEQPVRRQTFGRQPHGDVEVPAPKEEINQNALFPGMSKKDSSLAPHGAEESSATYKAGHPKGNTAVGKAEGAPNAHLKGRSTLGALPKPSYSVQNEGIVVVDIWVDNYGNVQKAIAGGQGTTVTDKSLWAAARAAAMKAHFNQSMDAPALLFTLGVSQIHSQTSWKKSLMKTTEARSVGITRLAGRPRRAILQKEEN